MDHELALIQAIANSTIAKTALSAVTIALVSYAIRIMRATLRRMNYLTRKMEAMYLATIEVLNGSASEYERIVERHMQEWQKEEQYANSANWKPTNKPT